MDDSSDCYIKLIKFDNKIREIPNIYKTEDARIYFNFENCTFLAPMGVTYLAAISSFFKSNGFEVFYKMGTLTKSVLKTLSDDGFLQENFKEHNMSDEPMSSDSVKFRKFFGNIKTDYELSANIINYINNDWLKEEWFHAEDDLKKDITKNMYELFANAVEHSKSKDGCFACGQKDKDHSQVVLTITDIGIGIVDSVKNYIGKGKMTSKEAILWAMQNGNSTRDETASGLGLNLVKDFIRVNDGMLSIYCNNVNYKFSSKKEEVVQLDNSFSGTMIVIRIKIDNMLYRYKKGGQR